ncbi:hypothetical protein JZK55_12610 [Dissulfurispira thermophila]|uniref:phosphoribosylglycinamide formyltransferase 1 n=1 Tax=Dissulfurispira thermophila TaxID=2715679 RepID=A0A7G1H2B1_9BACT|nr:formyltransferase family protein [Dissulfurispira thermophila]BCB96339.1 hypothetical protein JZK55_12610 [Dissulfurispira thermophila]
MKILFLAKQKPFSQEAAEIIKSNFFSSSKIIFGSVGEPFPAQLLTNHFDYVISYISPWIVPEQVLGNTKVAAINFHPGPPEYPGIGCTNFAIYNNEKEFGITVHHMTERVDSGNIITVKRFPIFDGDTVYSLTQRCYAYIYMAFVEIFSLILSNKPLPKSEEQWKRKPFTRKELNDLCRITSNMSEEEIKRRVRATTYPKMPGAFIEFAGIKFSVDASTVKESERTNAEDCNIRRGGGTQGS